MELKGKEISTHFIFPATVHALDWNGLNPVICDIEPNTLNIDVTKIEALITEKTRVILGGHVFGNPCGVEMIQEITDKHDLKVKYDGADALGSEINEKPVSSYGDKTKLSLHTTKLFNTIEGGALIFNDSRLVRKLDH